MSRSFQRSWNRTSSKEAKRKMPRRCLVPQVQQRLSFCVAPTSYVRRVRDALTSAEKKLFLRAWQLNRLAD